MKSDPHAVWFSFVQQGLRAEALLLLLTVPATPAFAAPITFNTALSVTWGEGILRTQFKYLTATDKGPTNRELAVSLVPLVGVYGVTALKKGGMFGGDKSPLDKADLPERERQSLVHQLGISLSEVPHDYGEYVRFLGKKGVDLYANRTMMLLYKIGDDEIEQAVRPIGLKRMVELLEKPDVYVAY